MKIGITVRNLSKNFREVQALKNLSMIFAAGQLHGIIGPDGAGKTTLLRILAGLIRPGSGTVDYLVKEEKVPFADIRQFLGYMPSRSSLYPDLSIDEHLEFFSVLYHMNKKEYSEKRKELLHITRLEKFADRKIGQLSGGMYKKVGLMCSLLQTPSILILDEPTNGVDPISRREFWELLYELIKQNIMIIVSTAYMDEAEKCEVVCFLESGTVLLSGTPSEILAAQKKSSFCDIFLKRVNSE